MLRAPANPPDRAANQQAPLTVARATLRDVPRIAVGHTAALTARRPHAVRWLIWPASLATALQLTGQVGRGEVFTAGHGSSVVMTPTTARRTPLHATVTAVVAYLLFVIVIPLSVTSTTLTIGGPAGTIGVLGTEIYLLALAAGPLLAATGRSRRYGADPAAAALRAPAGVRLHNLVRDPRDPAGTGVALLHAVIRDPQFGASTIITTAASSRLADAYRAAGMTLVPGSFTTLYRRPQVHPAGGPA